MLKDTDSCGWNEGERLLARLSALANPHRLRIMCALHDGGRTYVSQLARQIGISRPLLHLHLRKLEEAGLVTSEAELSADGKGLRFYQPAPFDIRLSPETIAAAAHTLPISPDTSDS